MDWNKKFTAEEIEAARKAAEAFLKKFGQPDFTGLGGEIARGLTAGTAPFDRVTFSDGSDKSEWYEIHLPVYTPMEYGRAVMPLLPDLKPTPEAAAAMEEFGMVLGQIWAEVEEKLLFDTGYSTSAGSAETEATAEPVDMFAQLERAYRELKRLGPVPHAIWFVDRVAEYEWFIRALRNSFGQSELFQAERPLFNSVFGMPIINHERRFMREMDVCSLPGEGTAERLAKEIEASEGEFAGRVYPWFCLIPGAWLEMSDGKHKMIVFTDASEEAE